MRILVVGAGAIGGYFGGRLVAAGQDVTFLVRPGREKELAEHGLTIHGASGYVHLERPKTVRAGTVASSYDLVLLSCKSFDLGSAIEALTPAVGPHSVIIPLLNGMKHMDVLDRQFDSSQIFGGLCTIHVTLNDSREVVQLQPVQSFIFGDREGKINDRVRAIANVIEAGNFNGSASEDIMQDMWEKWIFLASLATCTCLMRSSIGSILEVPGGRDFVTDVINECISVATAHGHAPRASFFEQKLPLLTTDGSTLTASMFRDVAAGLRVEADNIIGDLVARAHAASTAVPMLRVAYTHLKTYELNCSQ
jgi:2-dehydropantoate 2-reductase